MSGLAMPHLGTDCQDCVNRTHGEATRTFVREALRPLPPPPVPNSPPLTPSSPPSHPPPTPVSPLAVPLELTRSPSPARDVSQSARTDQLIAARGGEAPDEAPRDQIDEFDALLVAVAAVLLLLLLVAVTFALAYSMGQCDSPLPPEDGTEPEDEAMEVGYHERSRRVATGPAADKDAEIALAHSLD
eukprot:827676-Prymnesium_polylepis.1